MSCNTYTQTVNAGSWQKSNVTWSLASASARREVPASSVTSATLGSLVNNAFYVAMVVILAVTPVGMCYHGNHKHRVCVVDETLSIHTTRNIRYNHTGMCIECLHSL